MCALGGRRRVCALMGVCMCARARMLACASASASASASGCACVCACRHGGCRDRCENAEASSNANPTDGLAADVKAFQATDAEVVVADTVVCARDLADQGEQEPDRHFRDGERAVRRHPPHRDASRCCRHQVNVVEAGTAQQQHLDAQPGQVLDARLVGAVVHKYAHRVAASWTTERGGRQGSAARGRGPMQASGEQARAGAASRADAAPPMPASPT